MLIDISHLATESEQRRAALLADAENFRLARLVRQARRRRKDTAQSDPPQPDRPASDRSASDRSGRTAARRNDDAERRYAVSR
jgi:hypothetical protein